MPSFPDGKGGSKYHMNPQAGKSLLGGKDGGSPNDSGSEAAENHGGSDLVLRHHGDGTYHTEKEDGSEKVEHPDLGHALTHIGHHMAEGGKHTHIHTEGGIHHTHHIHEDGTHEGSHDHQNIDELERDLETFFNEEKQEGKGGSEEGYEKAPAPKSTGHSDVANLMF